MESSKGTSLDLFAYINFVHTSSLNCNVNFKMEIPHQSCHIPGGVSMGNYCELMSEIYIIALVSFSLFIKKKF